ncbi:MAG: glycosyltransferase family 2 protein [Candidatus Aenigmatarchaeota archaeon]
MPLVSIILLNYNGSRFSSLWKSLFSIDYPNYEIIFVDNGSKDMSHKLFRNIACKHPNIKSKIIRLKENVGYSKANNIGVKKASGDYIVLLSNDIEVDKYWLKNAIEFLEKNEDVAVAQSLMFNINDRKKVDAMSNYIDRVGFNYSNSEDYKNRNKPFEVFYAEGAVMLIKKKILKEVGGLFDEEYFMLFEDVDFCWRVHLSGYKVFVIPSSRVYHVRGGTVSGTTIKLNPHYVLTNTRNRLTTLFKNYGAKNLIKYLPISLGLELLKGLWLIRIGKIKSGIAAFCGIFSFFLKIPRAYKKRRVAQSLRIVSDDEIIKEFIPIRESVRRLWLLSRGFRCPNSL